MDLGKNILELRKQKNVTQEDMAAQLGVTATAVSKWENSYTLPDILMLCALADYFEVTTDTLLGRKPQTKYAIIASETLELGQAIAEIAAQSGIVARDIYTSFEEAKRVAQTQDDLYCLLAGYKSGKYTVEAEGMRVVVSVAQDEQKLLEGMANAITKYLEI